MISTEFIYLNIKHLCRVCSEWNADKSHCGVFNVQNLLEQRLDKSLVDMNARINT